MLRGLELLKGLELQEGQKFASFESSCALFRELGDPQNSFKAIHVAGTNGKGSVSAFLNGILMAADHTVGVTTSPHLGSVSERCLIGGKPVDDLTFSAAAERVYAVAQHIGASVTYFVLALGAALEIFRDRGIEWGVIECGLGGRLDATNSIARPVATVITSIGFDHTEILGNSIESIAANKAGIAKSGAPLFVAEVDPKAAAVIEREANAVGAELMFMGRELKLDLLTGLLATPHGSFSFTDVQLPLAGEHQLRNAALAVSVAMYLGIPEEMILQGLNRTRWPGRLELASGFGSGAASVLFDVAHNPEGIASLLAYLETNRRRYPRISFLVSILNRKDWRGMLGELSKMVDAQFCFTRSVHPAALAPQELADEFGGGRCFEKAIDGLMELSSVPGLVVVTGSSFLVGECRMAVKTEPFSIYTALGAGSDSL